MLGFSSFVYTVLYAKVGRRIRNNTVNNRIGVQTSGTLIPWKARVQRQCVYHVACNPAAFPSRLSAMISGCGPVWFSFLSQ